MMFGGQHDITGSRFQEKIGPLAGIKMFGFEITGKILVVKRRAVPLVVVIAEEFPGLAVPDNDEPLCRSLPPEETGHCFAGSAGMQ